MIKKSKILIVDDEARMCASLKTLLSTQGYEVDTCNSGNEALCFLTKNAFDLVILDIFMEGMDGFQVIENIRMNQKIDIPIIIMTGNASTDSAVKALRMRADDYLKKPFEQEELFSAVKNVLSLRVLKKENERIKKAFLESEKKYRMIAENMADIITTMDMDLRFTYVSPSIMRLRGFTVEEALEHTIDQVMTPDSFQLIAKVFEEELRLEATATADLDRTRILELEEYRKDGSTIWVENTSSFIRDKDLKPIGIIIVSRDISERRQAQEALRASERKYRQLFKNAPAGIYEIDFEKVKFINVNEVMCKYSGYSEEEFLSMNPLDLLTEDSKNLFIERLKNLSKEKNMTRNVEYNIIKKNGQNICVILNSDFIYEKDKLIGARVVAHDISELKQAQIGREKLIKALQEAFESIKTLKGLLPICSFCKKIRDDKGYWKQIESYIQDHSDAEFSHGICQECAKKHYPDLDIYDE